MMTRLLLPFLAALLLSQCADLQHNFNRAPVVAPDTGELLAFTLKEGGKARGSQFMAAMERVNDQIAKDRKAHHGTLPALGTLDPKTQKAGLVISGISVDVRTGSGKVVTVFLPRVTVVSDGVEKQAVNLAMPEVQKYVYKLLAAELRPVRKSELKTKLDPKP